MRQDLIEVLKRIGVVVAFLYVIFVWIIGTFDVIEWGRFSRVVFFAITVVLSIGLNVMTHPAMLESNERG